MITNFKNTFLSNFYPSIVHVNGFSYPTVEHAYQACKSLDPIDWEMFTNFKTPRKAKSQGKCIKLRADWDIVKLEIMQDLLISKFKDPILKKQLAYTCNKKLIEVNYWGDTYWGESPIGNGQNNLGKLLMSVRNSICL